MENVHPVHSLLWRKRNARAARQNSYIYIYRVSTCVNTNCAEIIAGQALAVACWAKLAFVASLLLNYAARPLREFLVAVKVEAIKVRRPDLKIGDAAKLNGG